MRTPNLCLPVRESVADNVLLLVLLLGDPVVLVAMSSQPEPVTYTM